MEEQLEKENKTEKYGSLGIEIESKERRVSKVTTTKWKRKVDGVPKIRKRLTPLLVEEKKLTEKIDE